MEKEPKVAIVILNWNGFDDTVECMRSLGKIEYKSYKVVLVDNASENNEGLRIKEKFPDIHLIQNKTNRGFAGGNNDGMNWALDNGFVYVVNLNNDTVVEPDWLTKLVNGLITNGANFGSSRIMNYSERNVICSDGDILLPDGSGSALNRDRKFSGDLHIRRIFSACGAGSIYSSDCLKEVKIKNEQYFDELYFMFYEDIDLGIRMNAKGYKGVCVPESAVYHKHSKATGMYSAQKLFGSEKNRILNELLNYPFVLIFLGEIFYLVKLAYKTIRSLTRALSGSRRETRGYAEHIGLWETIRQIIKARFWVLGNFGEIMKSRAERSRKGLIAFRLFRDFYWNIFRLKGI